ncbi:MAG: metal ABC transporter ATP-binding protein [Anaerolineae bacterium]|jgi:zinc transport system ATP-binding protein|nr:metal ABC transporter ATP-binding protein [Anaerolineae bacterium]MDH7475437.1 metal ABC transporter ATP-binding protein [Anaerolineae bacterium]
MDGEPIILLEHVTVAYQDLVALEDVNLSVQPGAFLAVIGPNGAGKTTLLKTILGLLRPIRGTVRVFGKAPWELDGERRRIGYVPQVMSVDLNFPVRAGEVVLMGRYGRIGLVRRPAAADRQAAILAMERVGVADLADRPLARLSGGQRQRVFLARALANEPELLLLDEPTTGVDVAATESLYELLRDLHDEGITILVVSHDVGVVASYVDAVACVNRRLVAHGRPETMGSEVLSCMYGPEAILFGHGPVSHMVVTPGHGSDDE